MPDLLRPSRGVLVRDLLIFLLKLWLDGIKDLVLFPVSIGAAVVDFVFRTRIFYVVLSVGERFDSWLNLFGASEGADRNPDGLFGTSKAGSPTLLGQLEEHIHGPEQHAQTPPSARIR